MRMGEVRIGWICVVTGALILVLVAITTTMVSRPCWRALVTTTTMTDLSMTEPGPGFMTGPELGSTSGSSLLRRLTTTMTDVSWFTSVFNVLLGSQGSRILGYPVIPTFAVNGPSTW